MSATIDAPAIAALQGALAAEHAAIWSYGLILAFVPPDQVAVARQDIEAHRTLRGQIEQTLNDVGARPVSAEPAYTTPVPVTDALSAGRLVVTAEADVLAAWRSVLEQSPDKQLRTAAFTALAAATVRTTRWRAATGTVPVVPSLPGLTR